MTYHINVTPQASADAQAIHESMAAYSLSAADRLYDLFEKTFESLVDFPKRHPRAPESDRESTEIRQIVVGNHRILFRIIGKTVHILRIRHTAQENFKPGELN